MIIKVVYRLMSVALAGDSASINIGRVTGINFKTRVNRTLLPSDQENCNLSFIHP